MAKRKTSETANQMFFAGKKGWNVLFFNVSDTSLTIWGDRLRIGDQQFFLSAVWLGGAQFCISATSFPTFIHSRSKMMGNLETYKKIYELFTSHLQNIFINIINILQYSCPVKWWGMMGLNYHFSCEILSRSTHLGGSGLVKRLETKGSWGPPKR